MMCSHFRAVTSPTVFESAFGIALPKQIAHRTVFAGTESAFIRKRKLKTVVTTDATVNEIVFGLFGVLPQWSDASTSGDSTFNTSFETLSQKSSFADAWSNGNRCIIPAEAIYEPDWRSGKAKDATISRADSQPLGIAGLWSALPSPVGKPVLCFTMLTVGAENYPPMQNLLRPEDDKRMVVILTEQVYEEWLHAGIDDAAKLMKLYPADQLMVKSE
jgi:putative SOS response-associated peptidase YedK